MCHAHKAAMKALMILLFNSLSLSVSADQSMTESYEKSYRYEQVADYGNAINAILMIHKASPKDYTANLRLAYLYFLNQNYANSAAHYQVAREVAPLAVSPLLGLMRLMNTQLNYAEAETLGYKIIQNDLYNYYGNLYLSYALRMNRKWDAASHINEKMLTLYPSDPQFLLENGLVSFTLGDTESTIQTLSYLLILEPENIVAKATLNELNNQARVTQ